MRVGILASSLSRGGAERQAALWAAACHSRGLAVEILALNRGTAEYTVPGAVAVTYVEKRGAFDLVRVGGAVAALARRVDVLAAFQPYAALFCAAQRLRSPWLLVTGEDPRRFGDTSRVPPTVLGTAVRRAALRVAPTSGLAGCYRSLGLGDAWDVVPNVVAAEAFASDPAPRDRQVLWVGRLVREKDPVLAVAAAGEAGLHLTVLGDGPLREEVARAGGSRVTIVPFTPEPWGLYRRHRALLLTSEYEAFGNVIVEALAAGTPVVAGDCDFGPREILAEVAGSHVVTREVTPLARGLRTVIDAPTPAAESLARARDFGLESLTPRIISVLERAASHMRPTRPRVL